MNAARKAVWRRERRPRATSLIADPTRVTTTSTTRDRSGPKGGPGTVINLGEVTKFELTPEIRGRKWFEAALEMMQDPHVKRSVEAIVDPLLAAYWDFKPGDKTSLGREAADYARRDFFECNNWERIVRLGATGMVRDGFALFELTDTSDRIVPQDRFPLHPGRGLGVGYTKAHHRPAATISQWVQSKQDPERAAGVVQWIKGSDVETPGERHINLEGGDLMLRLVWDQEGANFEGNPALRAAYGAFKCKRLLMTLNMLRHEREGLGIPMIAEPSDGGASYEATEAEEKVAKRILQGINGHERSYIYLPSGYTFEWVTSGGQATGIQEAIEQCNRDIAYNLGVAWMLLGIAGKTGSWSLATEQRGHYVLSLEKYARALESAFNFGADGWSPIERLIVRNYGVNVPLPRLVARNMPTRDWSKILPMLPSLVKAGLLRSDRVLREFVRSIIYFPEEDEATAEELTKEARALLETTPEDAPADLQDEEAAQQMVADQRFIQQLTQRVAVLERAISLAENTMKDMEVTHA